MTLTLGSYLIPGCIPHGLDVSTHQHLEFIQVFVFTYWYTYGYYCTADSRYYRRYILVLQGMKVVILLLIVTQQYTAIHTRVVEWVR